MEIKQEIIDDFKPIVDKYWPIVLGIILESYVEAIKKQKERDEKKWKLFKGGKR